MSRIIVVDNSALLPLFLADEDDAYAQHVLQQSVSDTSLIAPSLCLLEFGNAIVKAVRRNRLGEEDARSAHQYFFRLPIAFRDAVNVFTLPLIHSLAQKHGLIFYDATYLALAAQEDAWLATQDEALRRAAQAEIKVFV